MTQCWAHFQLLFVGCMKQHLTEAIEYKGLLRQCKKSAQANYVSHIIFFKGISTCVCVALKCQPPLLFVAPRLFYIYIEISKSFLFYS